MTNRDKKSSAVSVPGVMHRLKISPLTTAMSTGPVDLPPVKAPSLENLAVTVPLSAQPDLGEEDLLRRFHELTRTHGKKRDRKKGEAVELGDDVTLDTIGYSKGKLIPFSARFALTFELAPLVQLPGFAEALVGESVGDKLQLQLTLPKTYALVALRGIPAQFGVDLLAAREVTPLDGEKPEELKKLGRGNTLEEVMASLQKELELERADELIVIGQDMVLDEIVARAKPEVPRALVDEEIRRTWARLEAKHLVEKHFDTAAQNEALAAWLADPATRAEATRRLAIALTLKAIGDRDNLKLTPQKLEELVALTVQPHGFTPAQIHEGLRESGEQTEAVERVAWHLLAVEHVMAKAKISFEGD